MKIIILFLLYIPLYSNGQSEHLESQNDSLIVCPTPTSAEYPGGFRKMTAYIFENFKANLDSLDGRYIPKLFVSYTIYEDGSVRDVSIINDVSCYLENLVIIAFTTMPNWTPSYTLGVPTKTTYTIPIQICLR